jgi:ParB family transcriptional regulator, chromosome partitioning protein
VTKERRLGRGLEALLGQLPGWSGATPPNLSPAASPATTTPLTVPIDDQLIGPSGSQPDSNARPATIPIRPLAEQPAEPQDLNVPTTAVPRKLPVDTIQHNPHQPRQDFDPDELQRLADSILAHGLLQPVVVRPWEGGFQLIAGERRLRAARLAGWSEVPVTIVEADERQTAELAIVENMQRKDLNALEKAASFQRYLDQYGGTQEELAGRLKLDRSTIANLIRLLELPAQVQDALRRGKITPGHARALLPLGEEREQVSFCERVQKEGLNVRQTEAMVQETIAADQRGPVGVVNSDGTVEKPPRRASDHVAALEQEFRTALGVRVKITHDARGRGKVVIAFGSHEEFDQIRQHICDHGRVVRKGQAG